METVKANEKECERELKIGKISRHKERKRDWKGGGAEDGSEYNTM